MMPIDSYSDTVRLLASAQKAAAPGAPAYSVLVNRRAGRLVAAAAYRAGLSPNSVTAISAGLTFSGIALLALAVPSTAGGVIVWLLLALGYAFDSADGQVARLRGGGSLSGEWLDHVLDSIKLVTLHLAVLITAYVNFELHPGWLLVPIGFAIVASAMFFAMILNDQLKAVTWARTRRALPARARASLWRSVLVVPTDYGVLCLLFVTLGDPRLFFTLYSFLFVANACYFSAAAVKWFRDMRALDIVRSSALGGSDAR